MNVTGKMVNKRTKVFYMSSRNIFDGKILLDRAADIKSLVVNTLITLES